MTLEVLDLLVDRVPLLMTSRGERRSTCRATSFVVPPLSGRSARAAIRRSGVVMDDARMAQVVDAAGGNPLLLRELSSTGPSASPTLAAAIGTRVAALSDGDRLAVGRLALFGRPAAPELVRAEPGSTLGGLAEERDGLLWFTHTLVRDAVEESLDPGERLAIHRDLAERGPAADQARHHLEAGDRQWAGRSAERAAETASVTERARLLGLAVDAFGAAASDRLRLDAADALIIANRLAEADRIAASVPTGPLDVSPPAATIAEAGWHRGRVAWLRGDSDGAGRFWSDALGLVAGTDSPIEAHLRVELATRDIRNRPGDTDLRQRVITAVEVADRAGVDRAQARCLLGRALAHALQPGWSEHYDAAAEIAIAAGDHEQECAAAYWRLSALGFFGPIDQAVRASGDLVRRARELGQINWYHQALSAHALQTAMAGTGVRDLVPELERLLSHDPEFRNRAHVEYSLAVDRIDQGDTDGAAALIERARARARTVDDRTLVSMVTAELADALGDRRMMTSSLDDLIDSRVGFFGLKVIAESSAIHLLIDRPETPIPRFSDLCAPSMSLVRKERLAFDDVARGDVSAAVDRFARTAERYEAVGAPRPAARCLHNAARISGRSDDDERTDDLLNRARDLCVEFGFRSLLCAVDRTGQSLRRRRLESVLSDREHRILELVADGQTSADIARRLRIEPATVDGHIEVARRKLGATTREQAAAMLKRRT